ncbi:MAG: hypothetical protein A07HR60_01509 [uncultured archaeon A07HR60]|jgi:hypothetical protein|nr:MAG: hypothetical protein J07HR59_01633 [Halorubrum sp. J07HR59]ESS11454.1 MAG: hypothetical protein A07HR60_01509 [uncultured archaeon A07HR60]
MCHKYHNLYYSIHCNLVCMAARKSTFGINHLTVIPEDLDADSDADADSDSDTSFDSPTDSNSAHDRDSEIGVHPESDA